jgi:peptide-methionine (S)-S-oxide reductase
MNKVMVILLLLASACTTARAAVRVPDPVEDETLASSKGEKTAVLAGGCFWGVQAVFQHVRGVKVVWSGYAGGASSTAQYEVVSTGRTGHAESVQITYDPSQITYGQLLKIFFSVAHDPTELNRQGPDEGTQYRSAIFFANDEQKKIADAYIAQLNEARVFKHTVVTQVTPLKGFYKAEDYHQDYVAHYPNDPYVANNDIPKLSSLKKQFPELYTGK